MKRRVGAKAEIFQAFRYLRQIRRKDCGSRSEIENMFSIGGFRGFIHCLARNEWAVLAPRAADATRRRAVSDLEVKLYTHTPPN